MNLPLFQFTLKCTAICCLAFFLSSCERIEFTERQKSILESLSLERLPAPDSVSNKYALNQQAQEFGRQLFHDTRLSSSEKFSCASCHQPDKFLTDGLPTGVAAGTTNRNTPALHGVAWQTWFYWDGRRDSLWSQALTPIEAAKEMASDRVSVIRLIATTPTYRQQYETIFSGLPFTGNEPVLTEPASPMGSDQQKRKWIELSNSEQDKVNSVFANVGKALGAYQHTLEPKRTRFDDFIDEINAGKKVKSLNTTELKGAQLFLNEKRTQCLECHNGPLLSNGAFQNIATGNFTGPVLDFGREFGSQVALLDEFNCQGRYSDAQPDECLHLIYMSRDTIHMRGAYKTPTLRNIPNTAPYFHDGRFTTLEQVVRYYANPPAWTRPDEHELRPGFELDEDEIIALTHFLETFEAIDQ